MHRISPWKLWVGNAGDVRDLPRLRAGGIAALVHLAMEEPPTPVGHELTYLRFPLVDGGGNPAWLTRAAISSTAALIRAGAATLVYCSAGLSRSPSIAAAGLSLACGQTPAHCLRLIVKAAGGGDVSGGMWRQVLDAHAHLLLAARHVDGFQARPLPDEPPGDPGPGAPAT